MLGVMEYGQAAYVDYSGMTFTIYERGGEPWKAQVFVGVLGGSGYVYAEASRSQSSMDWIASHIVASAGKPHVREIEILSWLRETGREYEAWLALDDSPWLFSLHCQNLILVDTNIGFNIRIEQTLRELLNPYRQG